MAAPFTQTLRSLQNDRYGIAWWMLSIAVVLVGSWLAWMLWFDVTLYESTDAARIEVDQAAHALEARVGGTVSIGRLVLGRTVEAGEVLVELDPTEEQALLAEEDSRLRGFRAELAAMRDVVVAEEEVEHRADLAAAADREEAAARQQQAADLAQFAEDEARRKGALREQGLLSDLDALRLEAEARRLRSTADALALDLTRRDLEHSSRSAERDQRIAEFRRDIARLEGQIETSLATKTVIEKRIDALRILAPVAGVVGEAAEVKSGAVLLPGERVGAVIPAGNLRVVASWPPAAAIGRIKPGQRARVRLDAFPWTQYGSLEAEVHGVAAEVRDGRIRVELDLRGDSNPRITLEHGLTASVEVEIERVTPALLLMRTMGEFLRSSAGSTPRARAN